MKQRVEVYIRNGLVDAAGEGLKKDIEDLGIHGVEAVKTIQVYELEGRAGQGIVKRIGSELLADGVTQGFRIGDAATGISPPGWVVDVRYHTGVTDAVGASALKGIHDMGIDGIDSVKTSMRYVVRGNISPSQMDAICRKLLANTVIQTYHIQKL
ncbi:MAG: phosphoribosylformylglycinamidine synthase subunit PurS [bacterium]